MTEEDHMPLSGDCFSLFSCDYGILISAPIDIKELVLIAEFYRKNYGYEIINGEISQLTKCSICITSKRFVKPWLDLIKKGWTKEIWLQKQKDRYAHDSFFNG